MSQTRKWTFIETTVNVAMGVLISFIFTYYVLPLWGYGYSVGESLGITAMYTAVSFIRSFGVRRAFVWLEEKNGK